MYIDRFLAGVLSTVFIIMSLFIVFLIVQMIKKKGE